MIRLEAFLYSLNRKVIGYAGVVIHFVGVLTQADVIVGIKNLAHVTGHDKAGLVIGASLSLLGLIMAYYGKPHPVSGA